MPVSLQFRFLAVRSYADINPSLIEPRIKGIPGVERFRLFDDRLSDANFVTLVVLMTAPTPAQLSALKDALDSIANVRTFAVDRSGRTHLLSTMPVERLVEVAASDPPPP